MKIDTQTKQNVEKKENLVQMQPEDADVLASSNLPFSDVLTQQLNGMDEDSVGSSTLNSIGIDSPALDLAY